MQRSTASLRSKKYDLPSFLQLPTLRNVVENILLHRIFEVQRQSKRMCTRYNTVRDEISSVSCFSKPRNMEETKNPFEIDLEQTIDPRGRRDGEEISAETRQFARNRGDIHTSPRSGTEFLDSRVPQITGRYVADSSGREADGQNNDDRQG